jgi:thiosulfate/3-mercaptopyruvate sulfurtransferase
LTPKEIGPLVDVAWLQRHLDDPRLRPADCRWYLEEPGRGRAEYEAGHIPGAAYFSLDDELSAAEGPGRHPLPDNRAFAATLGRRGIANDSIVVAYDDRGGAIAARLWWMLGNVGHRNAAVLDGGLAAWRAAGGASSTTNPGWPAATYRPKRRYGTVDRDRLYAFVGTTTILDARAPERYRGEVEPIDPVAGHIPTAVNAPYAGNLDASGRFLDPQALAARYRGYGVTNTADTVVYCGSGVTACHNILAMEVAGMGRAWLFPGSWSDWSAAGYDVELGTQPE